MNFRDFDYCKIVNVPDGDTVDVLVDQGFDDSTVVRLRLKGINAPEVKGETREAGEAARDYLKTLILKHTNGTQELLVRSYKMKKTERQKKDKYGRYLAVLLSNGVNLNEAMVNAGHAARYMDDE